MIDPVPDSSNRLAFLVGRILHPYFLPTPTLFILLRDRPWQEIIGWIAWVTLAVLLPSMSLAAILRSRGHALYERKTRQPLYLFGWLMVLICLASLIVLDAPLVLITCLVTLALWAPLQGGINSLVTKLSAHAAVAAGCIAGLVLAGNLPSPLLYVGLVALLGLIMWARIATRNHTLTQVLLGALVGALPVLIIFPLML